jgi:tripeptidyl-peptidase-1
MERESSFADEHINRWDPVTGLGSPNYPKMLDLFLRLP